MKFSFKKKIAAASVAVALIGGGVAAAYWTTSGSGNGSASTGTSTAVTITQVGSVTGLVPGGAAGAVDFKISNSTSTPQFVSTVTTAIASVTPGAGAGPACTAADFNLANPVKTINADQAPGDTPYSPSGTTLALTNTTANQDNCKTATVTLSFTAA